MLAAAGWDTLPAESLQRFPVFDWDAPWLATIERVLLPSEPYASTDRHADEVARLTIKPVQRINGEKVSWYGSRAIAGMHYLARIRRQCLA